jgi:ParB family chromosome partitioning protein
MGAAAADVMYGGAPSATVEKIDDVGAVYREIDPALIEPNPKQPRQVFDGDALAELVHSIREFGLMQPIVVRAVEAVESLGTNSSWGSGGGGRPRRRASRRSQP